MSIKHDRWVFRVCAALYGSVIGFLIARPTGDPGTTFLQLLYAAAVFVALLHWHNALKGRVYYERLVDESRRLNRLMNLLVESHQRRGEDNHGDSYRH